MTDTGALLDYEIIDTLPGLNTIEKEWNQLWNSSTESLVTYSYQFTKALIEYPLRRKRERFWCIIARRDGKLVLVWPFVIYQHFSWRMASAIADTIDYSDPLMDETLDKPRCIADTIQKILALCPCDLVQFQFIRKSSILSEIVPRYRSCVSTYTTDIPQVIFNGGWSGYEKSQLKSERAAFARKRRNLLKIDGIKFEILPYSMINDVLAWMIPRKNSWLNEVHKVDETHMSSPNIVNFVASIFHDLGPHNKCGIFAITRGDEIVAADLCFFNKNAIQWYIGTYNKKYSKYSPGILLKEFIIKMACDNGLNYDMLRGFGRHKSYFANCIDYATTYRIPRTISGYLYSFLRDALKRYKIIH